AWSSAVAAARGTRRAARARCAAGARLRRSRSHLRRAVQRSRKPTLAPQPVAYRTKAKINLSDLMGPPDFSGFIRKTGTLPEGKNLLTRCFPERRDALADPDAHRRRAARGAAPA